MAVLLVLVPASATLAQDYELAGELPDSIIVTANRYPEHVNRSGRRVSVWTAEDIANLPVSSYDELLRTIGGVEIISRGGFGVQSDITMRGSTFNGVLVLLDGVRLNDPMTGHFLTDIPIPMSEIARIEIVRGPAAAIYGPDAVGGVIQIFTHAAVNGGIPIPQTDQPAREAGTGADGLSLDARAQAGQYGLYGFDVAARRPQGSGPYVGFAGSLETADGPPIENDGGRPIVGSSGILTSDFRRHSQTASVVRDVGPHRFSARLGRDHRDFSAYHFYAPFPSDTAREATTTSWSHARLDRTGGPNRWTLQAAFKQHDDHYVYNPVTPANEHVSRIGQIRGSIVRALSSKLLTTAGASAAWRSIDSNNLGRHSDAAAGIFYSLRWNPIASLAVSGSARGDYDQSFGTAFTPQVAAAFSAGRFGLHAIAGRSIRAPNYIERFFNTTLEVPRGGSVGSPNLDPERSWSYEVGTSTYLMDGMSLHATGFTRLTRDLIDYARLSPADTIFLARNLHSVRTSGIELDASVNQRVGPGRMRSEASITFQEAHLGDLAEDVEYQYVRTNARRLAQITFTYHLSAIHGSLQALWRDPLDGDEYGVVNARVGFDLSVSHGVLRFNTELRNVFDHRYSEVFDAPMPPRWWLVGIRYMQ